MHHTGRPYNSPLLNAELGGPAASFSPSAHGEIPAIKNIAVVGGLFDKDFHLLNDDIRTIENSLKIMRSANISMAPDMNFDFYNLLPPIKSDFMHAAIMGEMEHKVDALILCGLCNSRADHALLSNMGPTQQSVPYDDFSAIYQDQFIGGRAYRFNREISISQFQQEMDFWSEAAHASGAKIVITRGGSDSEINTGDFLHGDFYSAAIATDEEYEPMICTIPGSFGIVINKDAVAELKKQVRPSNLLGQRILAMPLLAR